MTRKNYAYKISHHLKNALNQKRLRVLLISWTDIWNGSLRLSLMLTVKTRTHDLMFCSSKYILMLFKRTYPGLSRFSITQLDYRSISQFCRCWDLNCRSQVLEATTLPAVPQPRPNLCWKLFGIPTTLPNVEDMMTSRVVVFGVHRRNVGRQKCASIKSCRVIPDDSGRLLEISDSELFSFILRCL